MRGARSPQAVAAGKIKDLTGVVIAAGCLGYRRSLRNLQAGDRRCGRDCRPRKGFSPGCPFCPPAGFFDRSRKLRVRGGFLLSPSLDGGLLLFELFSPRRRSNSTTCATSAAFSWRIVSFCAASAALSLASTAFVRSVAQCLPARLQRTSYRRLHRRLFLEHGDDSVGVTGAFRVEPRRSLSSVYLLSRPDQLPIS